MHRGLTLPLLPHLVVEYRPSLGPATIEDMEPYSGGRRVKVSAVAVDGEETAGGGSEYEVGIILPTSSLMRNSTTLYWKCIYSLGVPLLHPSRNRHA
jgi:hypothetical protein